MDRNALGWHLDLTSAHRSVETGRDHPVVMVCNRGFSSTTPDVVSLHSLGLSRATDLVDGFQGLRAGDQGVGAA